MLSILEYVAITIILSLFGVQPEHVHVGQYRALSLYRRVALLGDATMSIDLSAVSPFRRRVYEALLEVPKGKVTTYKELSRSIDCR